MSYINDSISCDSTRGRLLLMTRTSLIGGLMLAACGSTSSSPSKAPSTVSSGSGSSVSTVSLANSPLRQVQLVAKSTTTVKTLHLDISSVGTVTLPSGQSMTVTISGGGDEDIVKGLASFTMKESSSVPGSQTLSFQAIIDKGTDYMSSNLMSGVPGVDKPWISASISNESGSSAVTGVLTDPTQMLSFLSSVGTVTSLGSSVINGVNAKGYSVTVDLSKVGETADNSLVGTMRCLGTTTIPMKIWIDGQGRAVQVAFVWNLSLPAGAASMHEAINATYSFSKFGEPVSITSPSASDVQPLSSIVSQTTSGSSGTGACPSAS